MRDQIAQYVRNLITHSAGHVPMIEAPDRYVELLREGIERVTS